MKSHNGWILITLIVCTWPLGGCTRKLEAVAENIDNPKPNIKTADIEESIKERTFYEKPSQTQVHPLNLARSIQSNTDNRRIFVYPVCLAASNEGGVYISDNNAHAIRYNPANTDSILTLSSQADEAKLEWPNAIQTWRQFIFVSDNHGIKIFKSDGSFHHLLRTYYQINHFTIDADGTIYANPFFTNQKASNPLIVELNKEGSRVKGFGIRLNETEHAGLDNKAYLCATREYTFAIFLHRPLIHIFNKSGNLIREIGVSHSIFNQLTLLGKDNEFVHPGPGKYRLPKYIAGASIVGDRLLVLLDLPQPEIIEFNLQGQELSRYRADISLPAKAYRGFDARLIRHAYRFWILTVHDEDSLVLMEFTAIKRQ